MSTPRGKKTSKTSKGGKKSPRSGKPGASSTQAQQDEAPPEDSPVLATALEARKLFIYGGFGKKPTGGAQLWHSVVDLRKAYDYTPWVHKQEIEGYQGCNYYHPELLTLTSSGRGSQVWRHPSVNSSDPNANAFVPKGRTGHTCTAIGNGRFLIYGGSNEQETGGKGKKKSPIQSDINILDTRSGVWSTTEAAGKAPSGRTGHTATLVNHEHLFVIGGTDGGKKFFKNPVVLNTVSMTWSTPACTGDGPGNLAFHSAEVVGKQIWVYGGMSPAKSSSGKMKMDADGMPILSSSGKTWILDVTDPAAPVWSKAVVSGSTPGSRCHHSSCVMDETIFVFGGHSLKGDSEKLLGDLYQFHVPTLTWSEVAAGGRKPIKRDDACMVACGDTHILVYGGWTGRWDKNDKSVSPWTATLHVLDLEQNTWTKIPASNSSPPPRFGHSMVLVDYGGACPANCYASGVEDGVAGVEAVFHIQAMDDHNKPRTTGNDEFIIEIGGADNLDALCTDLKNGTYEVRFTPTVAGEYVMDILLREEEIGDNPYQFFVDPADTDPQECQADGDGLDSGAIEGALRSFNLYTRDTYANVTDPDPNLVSVTVTGASHCTPKVEAGDQAGIVHVSYETTVAGDYTIAVQFDGTPVLDSPFKFTLEPGPMASCDLSGSGASSGVAGLQSTFHILPKDQYGNSKSAAGLDLAAELVGPETVPIDTTVDSSGNVSCSYGATKAGTYDLRIMVAGQSVLDTPRQVEVLAGSPSAADSTLDGDGLSTATAGVPTTLTLSTYDQYGNKLSNGGDNVSMVLEGGGDVTADSVVDNRDGTYTITYTPTTAGEANIIVKVGGAPLSQTPTVQVTAGEFNSAKSSVEGPGLKKATAGTSAVFAIYLRDGVGNLIPATPDMVTVDIVGEGGSEVAGKKITPEITTGAEGQLSVSYQGEAAGNYDIKVNVKDAPVGASPFQMKCHPGDADPSKCKLDGNGAKAATAGEETTFVVQTYDAFGNPRTVGGDDVKCKLTYADGTPIPGLTVQDNGDGTYTVSYLPKQVGDVNVELSINGKPVSDVSPIVVSAGGASGAHCSASGDGLDTVTVGVAAPFKITTADEFGNARTTGGDNVVVQVTHESDKPIVPHVTDEGNGTYSVNWTAIKAGPHEVTVLVGGIPIKSSPFAVKAVPGSADASKSAFEGDKLGQCVAGQRQEAIVRVRDAHGNDLDQGGAKVVGTITGDDAIDVEVTDNGDGTYTIAYTPTKSGQYELNVTVDGAPVGEGNNVKFTCGPAAADASKCVASGPGLEACLAGDKAEFTVETYDTYGNKLTTGGDSVTIKVSGGPLAGSDVKDNGDGTYTLMYHVTKATEYSIDVAVNDKSLAKSPFTVEAESGGVDASQSSISGDHLKECVVGQELTATLSCKDGSGNPTSSDKIPTVKLKGPAAVVAKVEETSPGEYKITYSVKQAGYYDIEVYAGATPIGAGDEMILHAKPDKVDPARTTVYGAGLRGALSGFGSSFVIEARDRFGNLCPTAEKSSFVAQLTGLDNVNCAVAPGPDAGTFIASYTAVKVGKYSLQVGANGVQIKDSPFEVHVVPEDDVVGIDFGTTNCSVGVYSAGGYQVLERIPSVLGFGDKGIIFGDEALALLKSDPKAAVYDMKRLLGHEFSNEQVQTDVTHHGFDSEAGSDGQFLYTVREKGELKKYTCEALLGKLIAHLKDAAQEAVKLKELKHCAITVPAMFEDAQRSAVRDSVTLAGLNTVRILNESTAAAVAYYKQIGEDSPPKTVLVFDLGGGTFDVSAVSTKDHMVSVGASSGNSHLGGEDFDITLADHILSVFPDSGDTKGLAKDKAVIQRARQVAEQAKITLAKETEVAIDLGEIVKGNGNTISITRDVFDQLNMSYFEYIIALCQNVVAEAGLEPKQIDEIVMVGGSTYLPTLRKMVADSMGGKPIVELKEKDPIAIGVAVQAGIIGGRDKVTKIRTSDVATNSLGIEVAGGQMAAIIPRNTKLPTENQMEFATSEEDQEEIELNVYQGEEDMAADNTLLGQYTLQDIPKAPMGTPILVTFRMDESGVLSIEAESSGVKMSVEVEKKAKVDQVDEEYSDEDV